MPPVDSDGAGPSEVVRPSDSPSRSAPSLLLRDIGNRLRAALRVDYRRAESHAPWKQLARRAGFQPNVFEAEMDEFDPQSDLGTDAVTQRIWTDQNMKDGEEAERLRLQRAAQRAVDDGKRMEERCLIDNARRKDLLATMRGEEFPWKT